MPVPEAAVPEAASETEDEESVTSDHNPRFDAKG
jgi:hypothetical protein